MDYYSGVPEPNDYEEDGREDINTGNGFKDFFQKHSTLVLIVLAIVIVILFIIFAFVVPNSSPDYNKKSSDGTLSELKVVGGSLESSFSKEEKNYVVYANSNYITFTCKASSDKAVVEGCDEEVEVTSDDMTYSIKITAENSSVTRYYFVIKKANDSDEQIMEE